MYCYYEKGKGDVWVLIQETGYDKGDERLIVEDMEDKYKATFNGVIIEWNQDNLSGTRTKPYFGFQTEFKYVFEPA